MSRRRVLVVSPYFAPEHSGSAPYVTAVATRLAERYDVTVLTGAPHYPQWRVAPGYRRWRAVERQRGAQVVRLRHYVPRRQSVWRRAAYEATFAARVLVEGLPRRVDVVLAFSPPVLSAAAAAVLARRCRAPFGLVVHDVASRAVHESGIAGGSAAGGTVAAVEGRVLRGATGVVVLHEHFRAVCLALGVPDDRVRVIRNWVHAGTPQRDRGLMRSEMGWGAETVVLHSGNMGLKQGLDAVVQAARLASQRAVPVRFVLMGQGSQRGDLERLAAGVDGVDVVDPVPGDVYPDVLAAADVLLVHERPGLVQTSVPSKLTSYFAAGRPVVAATEADSPAAAEMDAARAGVVIPAGEPEVLLDAVLRLAADPHAAAVHRAAAQRFAEEHLAPAAALDRYEEWVEQLAAAGHGPGEPP